MRRVSAVDVVAAYKATCLIPIRTAWQTSDNRGGCALDVLAWWFEGIGGEEWAADNLDHIYTQSFLDAWDADETRSLTATEQPQEYLLGYWDAILCREAVEEEFASAFESDVSLPDSSPPHPGESLS